MIDGVDVVFCGSSAPKIAVAESESLYVLSVVPSEIVAVFVYVPAVVA